MKFEPVKILTKVELQDEHVRDFMDILEWSINNKGYLKSEEFDTDTAADDFAREGRYWAKLNGLIFRRRQSKEFPLHVICRVEPRGKGDDE